MTTDMAPPPPRNPLTPPMASPDHAIPSAEAQEKALDNEVSSTVGAAPTKTPMGPPPAKLHTVPEHELKESPNHANQEPISDSPQNESDSTESAAGDSAAAGKLKSNSQEQPQSTGVPYAIPPWSAPPCHQYSLEVLKDGSIIDQLDVYEKGAYMFGRIDLCDFVLEHPTISRFHAVIQFKRRGDAYLYDLGSTHGTSINKIQVKKKVYMDLHVGDVIRFGQSTRLYIFQGPSELMPPERDLKSVRKAKMRDNMKDMEASLLRAKREASLADGISWGMGEDAVEEAEEDVEEITWQSYKGLLTEKQEKTRDKVLKRLEKVGNMKKEIDAIRVKDISQGGLTQGQQTQIARNEQRIMQIMDELESLEETLNESIRESLGARGGQTSRGKGKGATEEEDEYISDDDEFYDRTKKPSNQKGGGSQSVETADSLLDKKDAITKEMEERKKLYENENAKVGSEKKEEVAEAGDALDAYMSGLSSQLELDRAEGLKKELSNLQSELDRILYLLNIADPSGEAARKRELEAQEPNPSENQVPIPPSVKQQPPPGHKKEDGKKKIASGPIEKQESKNSESNVVIDAAESKPKVYTVVKPQWLGAIDDMERKETREHDAVVLNNIEEADQDQFVDYKDRKEILVDRVNVECAIEDASPGLIIRKRKQEVEKPNPNKPEEEETSSSSMSVETRAEDAVALLLKYSRGGYHASSDEDTIIGSKDDGKKSGKGKNKKARRVLGPERPSFLDDNDKDDTWVPPKGQSGDGRTSLNDRYGY